MAEQSKTTAGADGKSPGRAAAEGLSAGKLTNFRGYDPVAGAPTAVSGGRHKEAMAYPPPTPPGAPASKLPGVPGRKEPVTFKVTGSIGGAALALPDIPQR